MALMTTPPDPPICANCHERPGTKIWVGEGGTLAYLHGGGVRWCELCVVNAQIEYGEKIAAGMPSLVRQRDELAGAQPAPSSPPVTPAWDREAFDAQLREDAQRLFSNLCEGYGDHSEALDIGLIEAAFRNLLSWAPPALPSSGETETTKESR